jgi:dihydrofolate reductase
MLPENAVVEAAIESAQQTGVLRVVTNRPVDQAIAFLEQARLKREPGSGLATGGVTLPLALAELGLIDEYEFVVHPRLAGHGPTLFAGLSKRVDLRLVSRLEFGSGAVAMRYEPSRLLKK